jgi:hypothetical protein
MGRAKSDCSLLDYYHHLGFGWFSDFKSTLESLGIIQKGKKEGGCAFKSIKFALFKLILGFIKVFI